MTITLAAVQLNMKRSGLELNLVPNTILGFLIICRRRVLCYCRFCVCYIHAIHSPAIYLRNIPCDKVRINIFVFIVLNINQYLKVLKCVCTACFNLKWVNLVKLTVQSYLLKICCVFVWVNECCTATPTYNDKITNSTITCYLE